MAINRPIQLGQFAGVRLAVHPLCLLYLPLGAMLLAWGPLTDESDNGGALTKWLLACTAVFLMVVSVVLHELGHLVTAVYYKLPIRQSTLYPFGGIGHMGNEPIPFKPLALMILSGPLSSLVQAGIWLSLWWWGSVTIFLWAAQFNLALALCNLLPERNLDGGRLLRMLQHTFLPAQVTGLVGFLISLYLALGLLLSGGMALLFGLFFQDGVLVVGGVLFLLTGILLQTVPGEAMVACTPEQMRKLARIPAVQLCRQMADQAPLEKHGADLRNGRYSPNFRIPSSTFPILTHNAALAAPGSIRQNKLPTLHPWVIHPQTSLLQVLHRLESTQAAALLLVEGKQIMGTISHDRIWQYMAAQQKGAPLKSTNLFMLLKSKTAVAAPLYLSGQKKKRYGTKYS